MSAPTSKDISELSRDVIAYTNGPVLLAQTGSLFAVALLTVSIRSYSRRFIVNSFGKDDWAMLFAIFASPPTRIKSPSESANTSQWYKLTKHHTKKTPRAHQVHMIFVVIGISVAKISVTFFLMRLTIRRLYSYFLWGVVIFLACFAIACVCTLVFQCIPIQAAWDTRLQPPPFGTGNDRCFSGKAFGQIGLFNGIINIATDILLALTPIPLIWALRKTVLSRVSLTIVLGLGIFAAIAGVMRQASMATTFTDAEPWVHDTYAVWNFVELNMGIIAASLPATKAFFNQLYKTARSLAKGIKMSGFVSNEAMYIGQSSADITLRRQGRDTGHGDKACRSK
ncbi:hypothetical protein E8E12_000315 [Didymella heteroderae]|uniref:Rhodopsin domain-containing protein n=1 Tax=Didymella heteroderae TaxID=1769908 RepID=A0A9P4WPM2_9PLEO|nr:hypothetical protein E8E12_000315 [Didymella heteroderae]